MSNIEFSIPEVNHTLYLSSPIFEFQLKSLVLNVSFTLTKSIGGSEINGEVLLIDEAEKKYRIDLSTEKNLQAFKGICKLILTTNSGDKQTELGEATILVEADSTASQKIIADSLDGGLDVNVTKSKFPKTPLFRLFDNIKNGTEKLEFENFENFIDKVLFDEIESHISFYNADRRTSSDIFPLKDSDIYHVVRAATEAFLMLNAGAYDHGAINEPALLNSAENKGIFFSDGGTFEDENGLYVIEEGTAEYYLAALYLIKEKLGATIGSSFIDARIEAFMKRDDRALEFESQKFYVIKHRLQKPLFIELIWSYWHEESMMVQAINAICQRFQNIRSSGKLDPLAEMEITHLLPLNNVLWGYIQDEIKRLSVKRRAYEYDHHYGISLQGKAVPNINSADSRNKFISAFHNLLHTASKYYRDSANKMVEPDSFPLFNSLREVNFIIAEGMHNQYGDLPWTARTEMLMQQWILSRSEFRNFLPGRVAVPYPESWMDRVASMNKLQGWTDTSPIDFNKLAVYGERLLLSIRFGMWNDADVDPKTGALWAEYFRREIQGYVHSYKAATGVDLTASVTGRKVDSRPPSYHLANRLKARSRQNGQIARPSSNGKVPKKGKVKKEWF